MSGRIEQAALNLAEARTLRAAGVSYRDVRRRLGLSVAQTGHIRRALRREKAANTRLRRIMPGMTERDLPISQSVLPRGLRQHLAACGFRTFGDLADRLADPDFAGLCTLPGIGPHGAHRVETLLDQLGLLPGVADLQGMIETLFPEFRGEAS